MLLQCPGFIPARCLQFLAALSATLSFLILGTFATWPSPTYPKLKEQLETMATPSEWAWAISLMGLGGIVTPLPAGYLINKWGRKPMLLLCVPFFFASWLLIIFARSATELLISRAIGGFGVGIVFAACPVYVAEIAEDKIRGILGTLMQLMMNIGSLLEFSVGPYVSYQTLSWISGMFPVLLLSLMTFMPESPCFHIMKNRRDRAEMSLMRLRGKSSQEVQEELNHIEKVIEEEMSKKGTPRDLVATRGTRRALVIMFGLIIIQQLGGISAILSNAQEIFRTSGGNVLSPSSSAIVIGAIQLIASFVTSFLVDLVGRRPLMMISTTGCALTLSILGTYQYLSLETDIDTTPFNWIPLACLVLYLVTYCFGVGPLPIAIFSEIFPSNVRGLALSIASMSLSLSFIVVTKLYQVVVDEVGVYATMWFFSIVAMCGTLFVYFFLVETKGKPLDSIVAELNGEVKEKSPPISVYTIKPLS